VSFFCRELLDERDLLDELLPLLDDLDLLLDERRPLPDLLEDRVLLDLDLEPWLAISPPGG
jgi:hypothetical protein